jgi:predicted nucleic acid-binding protein
MGSPSFLAEWRSIQPRLYITRTVYHLRIALYKTKVIFRLSPTGNISHLPWSNPERKSPQRVVVASAVARPQHAKVYVGLDQGEAEVLALAEERATRLVIVDEYKGRWYAQRLGFPLTGTLGVLLLAKERGLVGRLTPLLADRSRI